MQPSRQPSGQPTNTPSRQPSRQPTGMPSNQPSVQPSKQPTSQPTRQPSLQPFSRPTAQPSCQPTGRPTLQPYSKPTCQPSRQPTSRPTSQPVLIPTSIPSAQPASTPTSQPSEQPSTSPSHQPSERPSNQPTLQPTVKPTGQPTEMPSFKPTNQPTSAPSLQPFGRPSSRPSMQPAARPSSQPSSQPTQQPSEQPLSPPTCCPTSQPSQQPSLQPHSVPTSVPSSQPSQQPSLQPTARPTERPTTKAEWHIPPTFAPTVYPTVITTPPEIDNITVVANRTSLSLTVILYHDNTTLVDAEGGTLYCAQVVNGSALATDFSIGEIKATGVSVLYRSTSFPLWLSLVIDGLTPLTAYKVYCYVETAGGLGTYVEDVAASAVIATTLCCKQVYFVNAPPYVYDTTLARSLGSSLQSEDYVYTYALEAAPSATNITIRPRVTSYSNASYDDDTVASIRFQPTTWTFTSESLDSELTGRFVILTGSSMSGYITVGLEIEAGSINNDAADEFEPQSLSLFVLSSADRIPAPAMTSGTFSNSGGYVLIEFDSRTDGGGLLASTSWRCSALFVFAGADVTACTWTDPKTVRAIFIASDSSSRTLLEPGDTIGLLDGLLRPYCVSGNATYCAIDTAADAMNVTAQLPSSPVLPTVVLTLPSTSSFCSNMTIDASSSRGSGGRPWRSIEWSVVSMYPQSQKTERRLQRLLNSSYSSTEAIALPIVVPASYLDMATYRFTLTLTNFLGETEYTFYK